MKKYDLIYLMAFFLIITTVLSFTGKPEQNGNWSAPESAKALKNPTGNDKESLAIGKTLYAKHCRSCHGKSGLGDGTKAAELDTPSGDFSTEEFHAQTDGELFWKTTEGRDDMPTFSKKIPSDEDRWLLVNYMRTFKED